MELLTKPQQSASFATRTRAPQFNLQNGGLLNSGSTDNNDKNEPQESATFFTAGDHLKHLMAIDVKASNFKAVPICLFQHTGQCGGASIANGFCSRHVLKIPNGTIQTKHALISLHGSSKIVSMTGLVNQEPLVSVDNIGSQTTAIFPVFELMSPTPEQKDFTIYSNERQPLLLEQRWLLVSKKYK